MGGGVQGGQGRGNLSGLAQEDLHQSRDLRVSNDFRDVFGEVLRKRRRFKVLKDSFPGYRPNRVRDLSA